jgi:hypothetical protein
MYYQPVILNSSPILNSQFSILNSPHPSFAQRTKIDPPKPTIPIPIPIPAPTPPTSLPPPTPPPPPPKPLPPLPPALRETPNNPLAAPQNIDELLKLRMTEDIWMAMYSPLSCLDVTADCIAKLQQEAVQNSPVIKELEEKIATVNQKIEEAQTNNKKSIALSIFEPGLQVFLKQDTVIENGQSRKIGFFERVGQSRAIQISDLVVKVAEIERIKTEVGAKTREKIQQLVLDFDVIAREFQAEQAIAIAEKKSFKLYAVTYAAGDGDTNTYLNRQGQLNRTKLQVFKNWARVRAQITAIKSVVTPRDAGG